MKTIRELSKCSFKEKDLTRWIVEGFIKKGTLNILVGAPSCGKTMLLVLLATAIADGKKFLGHKTTKTKTLYISTETDYENMYKRFVDSKLVDVDNISLDCDFDVDEYNLKYKVIDYDLIIIDVLADFFSKQIKDNNNYLEVYKVFNDIRKCKEYKDKTFIFVTHFNKKGEPMGSQAYLAAADTRILFYSPNGTDSAFRKLVWYGKQVKHNEYNINFKFPNIEEIEEDLTISDNEEFNVILARIINYVVENKKVEDSARNIISKLQLYKFGCYETILTKTLKTNEKILKANGIKFKYGRNHYGRFISLTRIDDVTGDGDSKAISESEVS